MAPRYGGASRAAAATAARRPPRGCCCRERDQPPRAADGEMPAHGRAGSTSCGQSVERGGRRLRSGRVPRIEEVATVRERVRTRSVTERAVHPQDPSAQQPRAAPRRSDHELHHMSLQASWQRAPVSWRGAASVHGEPLTDTLTRSQQNSAPHKQIRRAMPYLTPTTLSVLYRRL